MFQIFKHRKKSSLVILHEICRLISTSFVLVIKYNLIFTFALNMCIMIKPE